MGSKYMVKLPSLFLVYQFLVCLHYEFGRAFDISFTTKVTAGKRDCFHQALHKDRQYEVEYQVLDGGDMDINFSIQTPKGTLITIDARKTSEVHRMTASENGDYTFCLDNSFSRFTEKLVYLELFTDGNDDDDDEDDVDEAKLFGTAPDGEDYDIGLDEFKDSMDRIHDNLQKSIQTQKLFAAIETRGRSIIEFNFERVNFWSCLQLVVMVSATVANVVLIRGLFHGRDKGTKGTRVRT